MCGDCAYYCEHCEHSLCEDCGYRCRMCDDRLCSDCQEYCEQCDERYCPYCYERHACANTQDPCYRDPYEGRPVREPFTFGLEIEVDGNHDTDMLRNHRLIADHETIPGGTGAIEVSNTNWDTDGLIGYDLWEEAYRQGLEAGYETAIEETADSGYATTLDYTPPRR